MSQPIYHVDAFTDRPFAGNPAGVCLLEEDREAVWMQNIAREMNLSETAFLRRRDGYWDLRWFTPAVEVDLCGHATLASAHVLWEAGHANAKETLGFETRSGRLSAGRRGDLIELDFPSESASEVAPPQGLLSALGIASPRFVGRNRFDYLIEVEDETAVRSLSPDFPRLAAAGNGARGVIVTSRGRGGPDFVSRFFAPAAGIDEDPVTGSAHCCLAPFWGDRLGKREMTGYQVSARGGTVHVR